MSELAIPSSLTDMIIDIGYRAKPEGALIRTSMSGYKVLIFYDEKSLQFYFGLKDEEKKFTVQDANMFNKDNRFARCYLDSGGISFEMDVFFDVESASAKNDLDRFFETFEMIISSAGKALSEASERD